MMTLFGTGRIPWRLAFSSEGKNNHPRRPLAFHRQLQAQAKKRCLRCSTLYDHRDNSPTACSFHGHTTGEKGLFSLAPPHQGIDGEWSDRSGVIVYRWNDLENRPNTGRANWKRRWSCCSEYDEDAPPCRHGWHVSYDDGFTLY
ncbi:hypothetical protein MLD38_005463 [Melastoma candidum]|uniref:Uncharacterized protein n=1 Tax=Melastoma candidum TaxID=119954 RepID=A0ACB9RNX5_9MYRT|nr:hypothetical protein MLD38_005463 [Melastoma candidum]